MTQLTLRQSQHPESRITYQAFLCVFFFTLYVFTMGGHGYGGVGTTTYDVTRSIVLERDVAIAQVPWGKFGPDGGFYAQYGIGHSIYNLPFYLAGHGLTKLFPRLTSQYDRITMLSTLLGQPCIAALTVLLLWKFCRKVGYTPQTARWCAILYGLGTQAWMYAQLDFSEPLLTFCLLASYYWIYGMTALPAQQALKRLALAGACLGAAVTVKIVAVIVLPLLLVYLWTLPSSSTRWRMMRTGFWGLVVFLTGLVPVGWYNVIRFGTPFETGYGNEFNLNWGHVTHQFWTNLVGLEGSIFLYSPVILLACWGSMRFLKRATAFALLTFGCIALFFIFYPFSTNELYYGPRYLTPTLPLFLLIAGAGFPAEIRPLGNQARRHFLTWLIGILLAAGIFQQIVGVVVNYHTYYWRIQYTMPLVDAAIHASPEGQALVNTPQLPHLAGHLWLIAQGIRDFYTPGGMPLNGISLLADSTRHNAWIPYYGLDLWWCHPALARMVGWPTLLAIASILIAVIGLSLYAMLKER